MITYTFSEAQRNLLKVLKQARVEEVHIKHPEGSWLTIVTKTVPPSSPFDMTANKTQAITEDILATIRQTRQSE